MKTYREQLNIARQEDLSIFDLRCGQEVEDALLEIEAPELDKEFENLCWQAGEAYIKIAGVSLCDTATAIVKLRKDGYTYKQISENRYRLVEKYIG